MARRIRDLEIQLDELASKHFALEKLFDTLVVTPYHRSFGGQAVPEQDQGKK